MLPSDPELKRAATRVVEALVKAQLLEATEKPEALADRVFKVLQKNVRDEAAIDREAERILAENSRQMAGMDQRQMLGKIKQKIARDKGFVL